MFLIPLDGNVHYDVGVGKSPIVSNDELTGEVLTMYGGEITGAAYRGMGTDDGPPDPAGHTDRRGEHQGHAPLRWAHRCDLRLARGGEKADGNNLGAAQVPGGSHHIRITDVNDEAIGNRDNQ